MNINLRLILDTVLGLTILIGTSCSSTPSYSYKDLEFTKKTAIEKNKVLSKKEIEEDINILLYALKNGYSGRRFLPTNEFSNLINELRKINEPMTASEFAAKINQSFLKVSDSHIIAWVRSEQSFSSTAKDVTQSAPVGKNTITSKTKNWSTQFKKIKEVNVLIVAITYFPHSTDPMWKGFIESVKKRLPKAQLVIIDLRGNSGGSDSKGLELSSLLAGGDLKLPYLLQWNSTTPESYQILINAHKFDAWWNFESQKLPTPQFLTDLIIKYSYLRDLALKNSNSWESRDLNRGEEFDLSKSIQKPIYILMDKYCASSCESTIDSFEYNTLVKKIGENTAGFVHFGNNGKIVLKNSHVRAQLAVAFNTYNDGRFIEKRGIMPDIFVKSGKEALDEVVTDYLSRQ